MARDADEELLTRLGVTAANSTDYERVLLAQVEEQARDVPSDVHEEQDVEAALTFLQEDDPQIRARRSRIQEVLLTVESEMAAVAAGREALTAPAPVEEGSKGAGKKKPEARRKDSRLKGGLSEDDMHVTLLDERMESLKRKRDQLRGQLTALEKGPKGPQIHTKGAGQSGKQEESPSPSASNRESAQVAAKSRAKGKVVAFKEDDDFDAALDAASGFVETERERLIRMGVITPFNKVEGLERRVHSKNIGRGSTTEETGDELATRSIAKAAASMAAHLKARPATKLLDSSELPKMEPLTREFRQMRTPFKRVLAGEDEEDPPVKKKAKTGVKRKRPRPEKKWRRSEASSDDDEFSDPEDIQDKNWSGGEEETPRKTRRRRIRLANRSNVDTPENGIKTEQEDLEDEDDAVLEGGLKVPGKIYDKLFDYQKTGVKWMWELHCQKAGGIIGDEMGLGKTIQVTAFLAALHYSGMYSPSIVICPVTLLRQWKREVKKWYPAFKAEILHDSAVKAHVRTSKKKKKDSSEDENEDEGKSILSDEEGEEDRDSEDEDEQVRKKPLKGVDRWNAMIDRVVHSESGLLITTYEQLRLNRDRLLDINWGYAVLDEGHRIRNPDAEVTLVCKQLQTVHRLIMTGAPIQNRLTELWSLFDFVFPGKLGVLPVFQAQFSLPIQIGGYANATPLQVSTAYKCAVVLRDLILPYLLRRMKSDVNANLTKKTEQVLFCSLTKEQRSAYRAFLGSSEVEQIMEGNRNSLFGIDILRKICNHPDLLEREQGSGHFDYGNPERSGKLKLVAPILNLWKSQGHRVLLFTQTQQMLDIIQIFCESQGLEYRRMDGSTPVKQRMNLIDEFNESAHVFLFILTTKVGGLGTNLTGANRVIIFDPDWNPSTDMQARERAWRIGQKKDVTIYRLITRGTIEEKVYHRQIYKQFLTNKILNDPQQRRIFKARDMRDLFTLQDDGDGNQKTETATLFGDIVEDIMAPSQDHRQTGNGDTRTHTQNPSQGSSRSGRRAKLEEGELSEDRETDDKINTAPADEEPHEEESRILKNLFEANGIHSAMDHEAILGVSDTEKLKVDQEAGRYAQRAADALRQSRMLCASDSIAVPTWTGRSGEAGAPAGLRRRFGSTTNSRIAAAAAAGPRPAAVRAGQNPPPTDTAIAAGETAGVAAAGSAAGRAMSSTDILNRMRERRMGALGAGLERPLAASPSPNRFGAGITAAAAAAVQTSTSTPFSPRGRASSAASPSSAQESQISGVRGHNNHTTALQENPSGDGSGKMHSLQSRQNGDVSSGGTGASPHKPAAVASNASPAQSMTGRRPTNPPCSSSAPSSQVLSAQPESLSSQIRAYLLQNGGTVASSILVEHFKHRIPPKDIALFRQLLREAATLHKRAGEVSKWTLKPDSSGS